jgi:drug/metabolite transporter (DMT)-like permease
MRPEREGELLMVGLSLIESWFPIVSILSIASIGALHTYGYSMAVALVLLFILMIKEKRFDELKNRKAYRYLLLTSFWITLLFILVFIGMRYTTAGNMAVIIFLQLLFSFLYFNVFGKENMERVHLWGAGLMGIGAVIILVPDDFVFNKGDLLILLAAAIAPVANLYQKRARDYCSSLTVLGFRTAVGLPVVFLLAYWLEPPVTLESLKTVFHYLLFIGIMVYVVAKLMWIEALHRISITKLSAMLALVPMMTLIFAYLFLDEVPQFRQIVGIVPILLGGYLLTRPSKPVVC